MFGEDVLDAEVVVPNFRIFRTDRAVGKGGGSCIYVHNTLISQEVKINVHDSVAVSIKTDAVNILVVVVYRPPAASYTYCVDMITNLSALIKSKCNDHELIFMGDFNLPDVSWDNGVVNCPQDTCNQKYVIQQLFLDFFVNHGLRWVIGDDVKTRRRVVSSTVQSATLDNVLTSDLTIFKGFEITAPLGKSDHMGVVSSWRVANDSDYISTEKRNWSKITKEQIQTAASNLCWDYDPSDPVDDLWGLVLRNLTVISEAVPVTKISVSRTG
eukprot:sb/3468179/